MGGGGVSTARDRREGDPSGQQWPGTALEGGCRSVGE
jgi:hypothetical protein